MPLNVQLRRLAMDARIGAPRSVRKVYRLARFLLEAPQPSVPLPQELLEGCELCASRYVMLDRLPKGGVVAELGTNRGNFANEILKRTSPKELHLVDISFSRFNKALLSDTRVVCHHGLTHEVMSRFADHYFDWIYVDADHSYNGAMRDAKASAPKLRPGGLLVFNDFAHVDPELGRYGVHRAVVDFILENKWMMRYFAMQTAALYDVALRKSSA